MGEMPAPRRLSRTGWPAAGKLLVATPQVSGPFFAQSVVLLLDYDQTGAIGLIINQKTSLPIEELFPEVSGSEKRQDHVYLGGPVAPSSIAFLIRGPSKPPDSRILIDEVHFSGSRRALEHALGSDTPPSRFHAYVGYAGWTAGQLDRELERGDWWVAPGKAALIFDEKPEKLWRELFLRYGGVQVWRRDDRSSKDSS